MNRSPDHDIPARIVALLLGLAALAERAASRPPPVRRSLLWILLPAHHVALTLLDIPADDARPSQQAPLPPETGDDIGALLHLAASFRAVAALLLHTGLNRGVPAPRTGRYATWLSRTLPAGHPQRRFPGRAGMIHDTS